MDSSSDLLHSPIQRAHLQSSECGAVQQPVVGEVAIQAPLGPDNTAGSSFRPQIAACLVTAFNVLLIRQGWGGGQLLSTHPTNYSQASCQQHKNILLPAYNTSCQLYTNVYSGTLGQSTIHKHPVIHTQTSCLLHPISCQLHIQILSTTHKHPVAHTHILSTTNSPSTAHKHASHTQTYQPYKHPLSHTQTSCLPQTACLLHTNMPATHKHTNHTNILSPTQKTSCQAHKQPVSHTNILSVTHKCHVYHTQTSCQPYKHPVSHTQTSCQPYKHPVSHTQTSCQPHTNVLSTTNKHPVNNTNILSVHNV